ncbi:MAG: 30S ribosomal protein S11 [SAR324 cluster bacterium]|uniref:Small ribosomal subunit protein uS11 n=1 Tax=SAR324 cluster bacterium TaxID=2024889 RepID=A0A2A4SLM8_9DELT|nr:MAG: 30S ribosomal protein S11 [SAR324 cluster bacterium]
MVKRKKFKFFVRNIAVLTIVCTSNNTIIHVRHSKGSFVISTGSVGLTGARRSTVYAAQQAAFLVGSRLKEKKIGGVFLFFKGFGRGRKSVLRILKKKIKILQLFDKTSISHNGCRSPKKRRL